MRRSDAAFIISFVVALAMLGFAAYEGFAPTPLIDPELGDVKLFVFIFTGAILGFVFGYFWSRLRARQQAHVH